MSMEIENEFPRPVAVDRLGPKETVMEIEARPAERQALARRFGLLALDSLTATVHLKPVAGTKVVRVRGTFQARLAQECVVTLAPVPAEVEDSFELTYAPGGADNPGGEMVLSIDADDPPEPIVAGHIDIGEAVAEHLALALEPFPRAPGAVLPGDVAGEDDEDAPKSPFAVLAKLGKKTD